MIMTQKMVIPELLLAAGLVLAPAVFAQSPSQTTSNGTQPQAQAPSQPSAATPSPTAQAPTTPSSPQDKPTADTNAGAQSLPDATVEKAPAPNMEPQSVHVKTGSVEDVNAVGTRNIGGRGLGNWYSTEGEIKMGKGYADEIEKSTKLINDPVVTEYVNRIGQNIVKNSDCKVPFTIKVIDTDEINAMALPGGFFYVNSGLILAADEEAELAGVMAHETAHVCAHHAAREMTRMNYVQLGSIPLIMMTGYSWTGYGIYEAVNIAIPMTFLMFSREFEGQADYLGVQYMYRAGYDPQAFVTFFEKIQNLEKQKPGAVAKAFSNHPQTPDRIQHTQEEIAKILPARDEYLVTTSEFDDVKARLARIENKRKLIDPKNGKPTLRRASTSDPNAPSADPNAPQNGDDRPTLHRREDNN
ncbi:M48 family metalloprotease [Alloacidobacterium dinghuense]|uniref:M48 family metalloprotease n=2 Tax=Alloacidobacterium dinghuense TaxID=2763107 RepID=A0A7G8BQR4_9BACT|nr:M48 family metallopeptidase [Alloacidobacterium dinghuense]QNI34884.1 M48 family metalloprotease [Alloacidobacterium dinghuense]